MIRLALFSLLGLIAIALSLELALRWIAGFGNPPLYVADPATGYRLAPNQSVKRFGKQITVNQYSMRNAAIAKAPAPDSLRILLIGDSIVNGGWWTDQSEILSAAIAQQLAAKLPNPYTDVEVLNASANSWGPRNELGYIKSFGLFDAAVVVVVINTDDLFATAPTSVQVGRDRSYPNRKPALALIEVYRRIFVKPQPIPEMEAIQQEGGDRVGKNLDAIAQIQTLVNDGQGQLLLAMTPLLREVVPPGSRDYEIKARQRLTDFASAAEMTYVDFLDSFQSHSAPESLYRDHIHLSPDGNALVTHAIAQQVQAALTD
ncbi:MAG: SGNH/GDSL hydrolase family protein [Cyanobacteria bacterium P01_C01_bin.73]